MRPLVVHARVSAKHVAADRDRAAAGHTDLGPRVTLPETWLGVSSARTRCSHSSPRTTRPPRSPTPTTRPRGDAETRPPRSQRQQHEHVARQRRQHGTSFGDANNATARRRGERDRLARRRPVSRPLSDAGNATASLSDADNVTLGDVENASASSATQRALAGRHNERERLARRRNERERLLGDATNASASSATQRTRAPPRRPASSQLDSPSSQASPSAVCPATSIGLGEISKSPGATSPRSSKRSAVVPPQTRINANGSHGR